MRILAVDDDPIILEVLAEVIAAGGEHEVVTATSAERAVAALEDPETGRIDCFLLDIQMPEVDGIQLCSMLRCEGAYRQTPIVMLTAMSEKRYIDAAFAAGATDYITKPFEISDIQTRLRVAEKRAREARERCATVAAQPVERVELLEQVPIYDVDNLIDYFAFENYVRQLSRRALFGSVAMAFSIRRVEELHRELTGPEFVGVIEDVAEALSDCLRDTDFMMAYAGAGTFITVIEDGQMPQARDLVDRINLHIHNMDLHRNDGTPLMLRVATGQSVRLVGRGPELLLDALSLAQSSAEQTALETERAQDRFWFMGQVAN